MLIASFCPGLFAYFIGPGWRSALNASKIGFMVGLGIVALIWAIKMLIVRLSLHRCPHPNPTELRGLWPWQW